MAVASEWSDHLQPPDMVDFQQSSMWPATTQALLKLDKRMQRLQPTIDLEQLLDRDNTFADQERFEDLMKSSKSGINHRESLARIWKNHQANAVGLLREQLDSLQQRRIESERKKKEILDELTAECLASCPDGDDEMLDHGSIGEGFMCNSEVASSCSSVPDSASSLSDYEAENSSDYWREKAKALDTLLSESLRREELLCTKLQDSVAEFPSRLTGELQQQFERFDNFLRFTLRKAPVVCAHQDTELRYRFVHNAFPTLTEEEVIGKTDEEIYQGVGVAELMEFKREVIRTKVPDKQEIRFNTNMFGNKTFIVAVEPVLDINDVCVGLNCLALDVTLQVAKREKLDKIREEEAVQFAMESELNKTIRITEENMRAKQMLATMAHEIRSPLSGVISMASVLARTPLNEVQKRNVEFMMTSGNVVLELINDILDLSKVEAGAMTFEEKKFRPREVVRHVLQMASASVEANDKTLQLETDVSKNVPLEVLGDVLRIRQVLTNLVSNSIKFTHEGKVSIVVRVVEPPSHTTRDCMKPKQMIERDCSETSQQSLDGSAFPISTPATSSSEAPIIQWKEFAKPIPSSVSRKCISFPDSNLKPHSRDESGFSSSTSREFHNCGTQKTVTDKVSNDFQTSEVSGDAIRCLNEQQTREQVSVSAVCSGYADCLNDTVNKYKDLEDSTWIEFRIVDTGIGISDSAIPTLFRRYTQASSTHAREYGGTGLGLHICKQLVELMGGSISVSSKENEGSTFSFKLPLRAVEHLPNSPVSSAEPECMIEVDHIDNMCAEMPESFQFNSKKHHPNLSIRGNVPRGLQQSPKLVLNTLLPINSDHVRSSTAFPSDERELDSTMEPTSVDDGKFVQFEGYRNRRGPHSSASLDDQGPSLRASCGVFTFPLDRDESTKSCHRSNASSTKRFHGGPVPYKIRSPSRQGNSRKIVKAHRSKRAGSEPSPATSNVVRKRLSILVADDDPVNVRVTTQMVLALGHELKVVNNGADAVQAVQQSSYDVVLMDVHMPVMDGLKAAQHIRMYEENCASASMNIANTLTRAQHGAGAASEMGLQRLRRLPIIAMTADALTKNIQECVKYGMDDLITKPVNLGKLEELLNQYLFRLENQM